MLPYRLCWDSGDLPLATASADVHSRFLDLLGADNARVRKLEAHVCCANGRIDLDNGRRTALNDNDVLAAAHYCSSSLQPEMSQQSCFLVSATTINLTSYRFRELVRRALLGTVEFCCRGSSRRCASPPETAFFVVRAAGMGRIVKNRALHTVRIISHFAARP